MRNIIVWLHVALLAAALAYAEDEGGISVTPHGFAYFQIGQAVKTREPANNQKWDQHANVRFTLDAAISERLQVILGAEGEIWVNPGDNNYKIGIYPKEGQGIYSFSDEPEPFLQLAIGYFPFKYNSDAQNLGEYLLRSGAYPQYIITDFENAKIRLVGLRLSSTLFSSLRQDLLFTSDIQRIPYYDYTLSYLLHYYSLFDMIDVGAGVTFHRLFPIEKEKTTDPDNVVIDENFLPVVKNGDTLRYTIKGTKLMGRISFDPKKLFKTDIFGERDLRLYAEGAILGIKNYRWYYDTLAHRIPFMVGFNFPAFNVLDVASLECELFRSEQQNPFPKDASPFPGEEDEWVTKDDLKWSLYLRKTIVKGFRISGLIASDHLRYVNAGGERNQNEELRDIGHWHYKLRFMYSF